jgi:hypothetical protein
MLRIPSINKETKPSYSVYNNNSMPGADLGKAVSVGTANECLDLCNKNGKCNSVEFQKGGSGKGYCYLKTYTNTNALKPNKNKNTDVYVKNPTNPTKDRTYTEYPNHWINGYSAGNATKPTPTAKDCMAECNNNNKCEGVEYWDWNGFCFLKSKDGLKHMQQTTNANRVFLKNPIPVGESYLMPDNLNVISANKYKNYNISSSPMSSNMHDVSLMPKSITTNFNQSGQQLRKANNTIVNETDRIINEGFTTYNTKYPTRMYINNSKQLSKINDVLNNYVNGQTPLLTNINTLNKMVENSSLQMTHLNIVYTIMFVITCILLVIAFTISL